MTLHDRIMAMTPDSLLTGKERGGFYRGRSDAAKLATEADELMAEMAELIDKMADIFESELELPYEVECRVMNTKYYTYKERNNEQ